MVVDEKKKRVKKPKKATLDKQVTRHHRELSYAHEIEQLTCRAQR